MPSSLLSSSSSGIRVSSKGTIGARVAAASSGEGIGWAFRPYRASGSSGGGDVVTGVPYQLNQWQHVVFTWEPQTDVSGDSANGGVLWERVLTAYVDGTAVATNSRSRRLASKP